MPLYAVEAFRIPKRLCPGKYLAFDTLWIGAETELIHPPALTIFYSRSLYACCLRHLERERREWSIQGTSCGVYPPPTKVRQYFLSSVHELTHSCNV